MSEIWKPVFDGKYEVSSLGKVKTARVLRHSLRYLIGRHLTQILNETGYMRVCITVGGKKRSMAVHSVVALGFIGPRPEGMNVNHKNGNKTDNRPENLEYTTPKQNTQHALRNGLLAVGERQGSSKLTDDGVREIRRLHSLGESPTKTAKKFKVSKGCVEQVVYGTSWRHVL